VKSLKGQPLEGYHAINDHGFTPLLKRLFRENGDGGGDAVTFRAKTRIR